MANRRIAVLGLTVFFACLAMPSGGQSPDYSKEAFVIQSMATKVTFSANGSRDWQQISSIKIQSEAAVRQYGVLAFFYGSETEQMKVEYVRVRKPDGSVVATPDSSVLDVATEVATAAPTYSDLRQKQIPVKALGVGDVLEYSVISSEKTPEIPGQFWYDQNFIDEAIVLGQTLEVRLPKDNYVQVSSPKLKPEVRDESGQRIYLWKHSHLEPAKSDDKKLKSAEREPVKVRLTTFRNWEAVGEWWAALATPQAAVTPAIQEKAKELTANLPSNAEKERAIYEYVSLKFRYISISLGAGRYRPHSAAEVLANQYGDCKDKHILFVALLKAAGIQAWPALIGVGIKFDEGLPSPAQFNHVVTVIPEGAQYSWADTTAEVAPFGLLTLAIRDEQALVIPDTGKARLVKTPINPPFPTSDSVNVKAALDASGTLNGRFDIQVSGDAALGMRAGFRQLAPAQWQELAQQISYAMGYAGEVSGVELENLETPDKPFHFSYQYSRKNYSDWENHKITAPVPPLGFGPGDEAEEPKQPFWAGSPGEQTYGASVHLPKGFSIELPPDTKLTSDFAEYSAHYTLADDSLLAERKMIIKKAKVTVEQWADYQKFSKGIRQDQAKFLSLSEGADVQTAASGAPNNPEAAKLVERASLAIQSENRKEVNDLLSQVERLNPKQAQLWAMRGYLASLSGNTEEGISDCRKEVQFHPDETPAYQELATLLVRAGHSDEAIDTLQRALAIKPEQAVVALQLTELLMKAKKYNEIFPVLEKQMAAAPDNLHLQAQHAVALLRAGRKDEGIAEAQGIANKSSNATILNDLAYAMSDTGSDTGIAQKWIQRGLDQTEQDAGRISLDSLENQDLNDVNGLAAEWDTLGWTYFKEGNLSQAEKYVNAAWQLGQHAEVGNHLGQIYEQQGKKAAAIHMWQLALASNSRDEDLKERLRLAGAPASETPIVEKRLHVSAPEELVVLRTIKIPALPKQAGSAEFFLVLSKQGIESIQFISGSDTLRDVLGEIRAAKYAFPFPDSGPEKLLRRGVLSCSTYANPSCELTMLPSTSTTMPKVSVRDSRNDSGQSAADVSTPTLLEKVEPDYTKAALKARLEGTVHLALVIDEAGRPRDIVVTTPLGMGLDENAVECVSKWRFSPAQKNGKPVSSPATVEVKFRLFDNSK